jgi:hypothetical protein
MLNYHKAVVEMLINLNFSLRLYLFTENSLPTAASGIYDNRGL